MLLAVPAGLWDMHRYAWSLCWVCVAVAPLSWWRKQRLTNAVRRAAKRKESFNKGSDRFQIWSLVDGWEDVGSAFVTARFHLWPEISSLGLVVWVCTLIIVLMCHRRMIDQQTAPNPTGLGYQALAEEWDVCSRCSFLIYTVRVIPTLSATHIFTWVCIWLGI